MSSERSKKRKRSDWKDLPAFLDSSATVSATTFAARRLPEIKALWNVTPANALTDDQLYQSSGGKTSSRHLRRRTTSHKPRKKRRYRSRGSASTSSADRGNKRPCRRARRRPASLRKQHESWQSLESESSSQPAVNWLTTHIWHAKRFHMHDNFFGWNVPLVHNNRGGRAALRLAAENYTLIQDVTWRMQPLIIGSAHLKTLLQTVQQICPHLLPADNPNAVLSGSCFREGVLHEPDKFPIGAIGPAKWWICSEPFDAAPTKEKRVKWFVYIFVHPAIRTAVRDLLLSITDGISSIEGPRDVEGGLVCFQLRGTNATASIKRALGPVSTDLVAKDTTSYMFDWNKACDADDLHAIVPHLTIISVQVSLDEKNTSVSVAECKTEHAQSVEYIDSYNEIIRKWNPSKGPSAHHIGNGKVIIVAQCPCVSSLKQNSAVCGWDVLCHPSDASKIFHALNIVGKACAIGVVEESLACVESEPPLPIFPRDYPDTKVGQCYWTGDSSEWKLLRKSLEQGWGRIKLGNEKEQPLFNICWSDLLENGSGSGAAPVVVRGGFGKPFVDALAGCGHLPPASDRTTKKKRRPRRPVRPPSTSFQAIRLTSHESIAHENRCDSLLQSLSLPALLRCHVRMEGKGTVAPGSRILSSTDDEDYLLGICVAGSFSMSRGSAHGVGFVGAARLLQVLASEDGRLPCVVVRRSDGTKHLELKATVKALTTGSVERTATISLLL